MNKAKGRMLVLIAMIGVWAMPLAPIVLVGCSGGCAALDKGADPVVVRAEQTYQGASQIFKSFTTFEFNNRAYLQGVSGDIEKAANTIRTDGFDALVALQNATIAYKSHRTANNKANLETWLATVEKLDGIVTEYLARAKPKQEQSGPPKPPKQ